MTLSLRHVYVVFILAIIVAFTIKARAADSTGNRYNRLQDGLAADGSLRPGTNCILCGLHMACGDLSLDLSKQLNLRQACKNASASVYQLMKNCADPQTKANLERELSSWDKVYNKGKLGVENYRSLPDSVAKARVDILGMDVNRSNYLGLNAIPSYDHYRKIKNESNQSMTAGAPQIDISMISSELDSMAEIDKDIRKDVVSCVEDANKEARKKFKSKGIKEITEDSYFAELRSQLGLDTDYIPTFVKSHRDVCRVAPKASAPESGDPSLTEI